MKRMVQFLLIFTFSSCVNSQKGFQTDPIAKNNYGSIAILHGVNGNGRDSVLYFGSNGINYSVDIQEIENKYPSLYKDKITYIIRNKLFLLDPQNKQRDSIDFNTFVLSTAFMFEYDSLLIVQNYNKLVLLNIETKKILVTVNVDIANSTLNKEKLYFISSSYSQAEDGLLQKLISVDLNNLEFKELGKIKEMIICQSSLVRGWSGMKILNDVLFVSGINNILAFDIKTGRIIDSIAEFKSMHFKSQSNKVIFEFENKPVIEFSFLTMKFQKI